MYQITTTAAASQTIIYLLLIKLRIGLNYKAKYMPFKSIICLKQNTLLYSTTQMRNFFIVILLSLFFFKALAMEDPIKPIPINVVCLKKFM